MFHHHFDDIKAIVQDLQSDFITLRKQGGEKIDDKNFEKAVNKLQTEMQKVENNI